MTREVMMGAMGERVCKRGSAAARKMKSIEKGRRD